VRGGWEGRRASRAGLHARTRMGVHARTLHGAATAARTQHGQAAAIIPSSLRLLRRAPLYPSFLPFSSSAPAQAGQPQQQQPEQQQQEQQQQGLQQQEQQEQQQQGQQQAGGGPSTSGQGEPSGPPAVRFADIGCGFGGLLIRQVLWGPQCQHDMCWQQRMQGVKGGSRPGHFLHNPPNPPLTPARTQAVPPVP